MYYDVSMTITGKDKMVRGKDKMVHTKADESTAIDGVATESVPVAKKKLKLFVFADGQRIEATTYGEALKIFNSK